MNQPQSGMLHSNTEHTIQSERVVSSAILGEHFINGQPEDCIKYVEVPVIEEVIRHVPRKEIVEIEKRVPRYEYEWVEKIVEVPQIQTINKHVEVPQIQEVVKHVPVKQVVDVVKEVVRYVPRVETKIVEQEVEVPGEIIEVPKPYLVENKIVVPRYIDREIPTVVAQRLQPVISESSEHFTDVELKQYEPYLVAVDVYIPRPVHRNLIATSKTEEHRVVDVPPAQYNALVKSLNSYISDKDTEGLFVKMSDGGIPVLQGLGSQIVSPTVKNWAGSHIQGQQRVTYSSHNTGNAAANGLGASGFLQQDTTVNRSLLTGGLSTGAARPSASYYSSTGGLTTGYSTSTPYTSTPYTSTPYTSTPYTSGIPYTTSYSTTPQVISGGSQVISGGSILGGPRLNIVA